MNDIMRPATEWELKSMMAALAERAIPVEILGAGSKRGVGRPVIAPRGADDRRPCAAFRCTSRPSS